MKEILQLQAFLKGISTHVDGGLGIRLDTQEINTESKIKLLGLVNKMGWFCFKESDDPLTEEEIPQYNPEQFDQIKSPSIRMRAVLFRMWEQDPQGYSDADSHYRAKMEKIINQLKSKLT